MPISVADLKNFATERTNGQHSEIELRAAISRAYYAAFHAAAPFVEMLPRSKKCPKAQNHLSHQELTDRLHEWKTAGVHPKLAQMTETRNQLVNTMEAARTERVRADYRLALTCDETMLKAQLQRLGRISQVLTQINGELKRQPGQADSGN